MSLIMAEPRKVIFANNFYAFLGQKKLKAELERKPFSLEVIS